MTKNNTEEASNITGTVLFVFAIGIGLLLFITYIVENEQDLFQIETDSIESTLSI